MNPINHYFNEVKARIAASALVRTVTMVSEYLLLDRGYIRMRLTLNNGDFLELSEYVVLEATALTTVTYRYQWMAAEQGQLRKRWDNAPHFPHLANFPHHVHVGADDQVIPGKPLNILELLNALEHELALRQD
jgi:hypothetical protein